MNIPQARLNLGYEKYLLSMLGQIVLANEYASQHFSGLRQCVRVDVSVYQDNEGKFHYFVNELAHCMNTGLWGRWGHDEKIHEAWEELSYSLEYAVRSGMLSADHIRNMPLPES